MKKTIKLILFASLAFTVFSCNRSYDEINLDDSKIYEPEVSSFLAPIQYNMASVGYSRANDFTFDIMQVSLDFPNEGNSLSRYYLTENTGAGFWNNSYKWIKQVYDMRKAAVESNDKNYEAIALVLNAWIYANLTDTYGDIPFSEASKLDEGIALPKFDSQKNIYAQLLDDLKRANSLFITNKTLSGTDLFYNAGTDAANGINNWKKFCNSLSLRLLTRILNKNGEVDVIDRIKDIVNNPTTYPIFTSNAESAKLNITGIAPLMPPIARPQDFTTGRAASEFFVETLKSNNDPRMSMFFSQATNLENNTSIGYKGAASGYNYGTVFSYQPSNMNQNLAKAPLKILIMPYAELQFILSELAFRGIISGSAQTYYENGVKATIEQWNAVVPANYFTNPNVAYNGTLERILLQKYVALFFVDQQQWFEKRRTGFPVLPNNGGLLNDGKLPSRLMYPPNPKVLNTANYQAAVQQMGGDDINTKVWWNK
ncbi:SusD/RagB family nutrient-binding outer membrane lipoprotein [Chryseobacterium sp. NEB161]|nr:SusD/RagB family nutrient-binding outer membrane lipoprotein [Chryseobacterium sp. NEB161]